MTTSLLEQSSRIALAAFLHDLGKFAERARLPVNQAMLDANKQLYCPHRKQHTDDKGFFSHVHAAYTGLAMDVIEPFLPDLTGENFAPFGGWKTKNVDDSFINASAKHHKPETFLQWVIATADRVASGFDREEFEEYNHGDDITPNKKNHYTARQLTLFEQIHQDDKSAQAFNYRYELKPLSVKSLFPVLVSDYETHSDKAAQEEYLQLWNDFVEQIKKIPKSHRDNWALWLDHFETLWGVFTQAIPSATAFNIRPDVSLYDHSRVTAALATALWRYHHETQTTTVDAVNDWTDKKYLLIQGDFFGIQDFIFASGAQTNKRAAKLLRGRSFYVSLLSECAALKVLDALELPSTSQVINAAGKFMIVAPKTDETIEKLKKVQACFDKWFLARSWGQAGVGLAWKEAACVDFCRKTAQGEKLSPYQKLIKSLFEQLEIIKLQRFHLCDNADAPIIFTDFLDQFHNEMGVCEIDGKSPAKVQVDNVFMSQLAQDQINAGNYLVKYQRILLTKNPLQLSAKLDLALFGYHVHFVGDEDAKGKFGEQAKNGNLLRVWDFSLPETIDAPLWHGYARRNINAYIPFFDDKAQRESQLGKYQGEDKLDIDDVKTLNHLACEDKKLQENHQWLGIQALSTLKGDVDNLGTIFQSGLGNESSFSKTAALSRQMNAFFAVCLPYLCQQEFPNTYTVFAGGDDFFLIGPWLSQIKLAQRMCNDFKTYVANNTQVHFSAGLSTTKSGLPIAQLADLAEEALDKAKAHNPKNESPAPKNAVTCFNQTLSWTDFDALMNTRYVQLEQLTSDLDLSTGYIYGLLYLIDMAEKVAEKPENALWHSYFAYRTVRMLERNKRLDKEQRKRRQLELAQEIAHLGIEQYKGDYRIALFCYLYQQRG